jgi:hypothetical protein
MKTNRYPHSLKAILCSPTPVLLGGLFLLLVCARTTQAQNGTFTASENWSVTIAEDNGQTPTFSKTYQGTATGTLTVSNGNYVLINETGLSLAAARSLPGDHSLASVEMALLPKPDTWHTHGLDTNRVISGGSGGYEIDGSYPVVGFSGNYAIVQFTFFMVKVELPVTDFAVPVVDPSESDIYTTTGSSLASLSGAGDEADENTGFSASASSTSSLTGTAPAGTVAPEMTTQPMSQNVMLGASSSFSVNVTGTQPLSFQWMHDGTNLIDGGEFSGSSSSTLTITGVESADAGNYSVVVSNIKGAVTSDSAQLNIATQISLIVVGPGTVSGATNGQLLAVGQNVTLKTTPAFGCVLTNWLVTVGGLIVVSTNKDIPFVMQPNLALTATFVDVAPPTVSITAPVSGERLSNAVLTVTGKAEDNVAVSNVFYSVNNDGWSSAATANNWSTWTAQVSLTPGTNLVAAYAVDTSGNLSKTNLVRCVYVLSAPLSVTIQGEGQVKSDYNKQWLTLGGRYSMTATGSNGFKLTNWTGGTALPLGVITNGPTVQFLMVSNLMLQANFVDVTRPTNILTAPTPNEHWSNEVFTITGKAGDNVAVSNVLYSVNNGGWNNAVPANHWSNWTAQVSLTPGTNLVAAYSVDTSGNRSKTNSVSFVYVVSAPLNVGANGEGTIKPDYNHAPLQIGANYSMTASGTNGCDFVNWTDGNGSVLTNGPTLKFVMASNLMFFANFADTTKPAIANVWPSASVTRLTNALATIQVRATDNIGVRSVEFFLNGQYFGRGFGWTSNLWTMDFAMPTGTNLVQTVAIDTSGNRSATNSVRLVYLNNQTNANSINYVERGLEAFYGTPYFDQETKSLNAALAVPGLSAMPAATWSNLFATFSFGDFAFVEPMSQADVLTTNQAVFYYIDGNYGAENPAVTTQLTFSRIGDVLGVVMRNSASTYVWGQSFSTGDFDWNAAGGYQLLEDQQTFSLLVQDGGTTNIDITQTVYINGTNTQVLSWTSSLYLEKHEESGLANFTGPTIAITAPVDGQHWTNPVFTVKGTVKDVSPTVELWYQLNTNDWEFFPEGGQTNWSAGVELTPGTNTVRAYATDAEGYQSATVTRQIVYVLDLSIPTNTFVFPTASSATLTNGLVTVQVRATDNVSISTVRFYLNGQDFGPGLFIGTNIWVMDFSLTTGTNTVAAVATDVSGNLSATNTIRLVYVNTQTNANAITVAEHDLETYTPGPPGIGAARVQDTCLLDAALAVDGLQSMSSETWSNLFVTMSFGFFTFSQSLGEADALTTNQAVFYFTDTNDPSANPVQIAQLTFTRAGNVLRIALQMGSPTYLDQNSLIADDYYWGWFSAIKDQQPFSLSVLDGDTGDTYAGIIRPIYFTGTPSSTFSAQADYYINRFQLAGGADYIIPTNTITAPLNGQRWSNSVFTVTGKARDNLAVSNVWVQVNADGWQPASTSSLWTNWWAAVSLVPGTNFVQSFAVDASGNCSPTNLTILFYVKSFALADYSPLLLGAQWAYSGTDNDGLAMTAQFQVASTNDPVTLYAGSPVRSYQTNCVEMLANFYSQDDDTLYDSWQQYWCAPPRVGMYGDDDYYQGEHDDSFRVNGAIVFPAQMTVGASVTLSATAYEFGTSVGTFKVVLQLLENTSLTVAAGSFPDVLHLRETITLTGKGTKADDYWWARGVGTIKRQGISGRDAPLLWTLTSYSIPPAEPLVVHSELPATRPPVIEAQSANLDITGNGFGFNFTGEPHQVVVVEASSDLVHWQPFQTNVLAGVPIRLSDSQWTNYPCRFYRMKSQ